MIVSEPITISSSAFPADKTPQIQSQIHEVIRKHLVHCPLPELIDIRAHKQEDLVGLRSLQKEWFPLDYSDYFYNKIKAGASICYVAEVQLKPDVDVSAKKYIIGAIVFQLTCDSDHLVDDWLNKVFTYDERTIYIMTLGVVDEMRSKGLANKLLEAVIQYAKQVNKIRLIALHVVAYNKRAIHFYKKNSFLLLQYIEDHYNIMGKEYPGLKLGLFVNEGKRRQGWLPWFRRVVLRKKEEEMWPQ